METFDNDHMLEAFFSSMKEEDKYRMQPAFPEQYRNVVRPLWIAAAGIAASLIIGFVLVSDGRQDGKLLTDQIVFTLYEDDTHGTSFFGIKKESSMDTWEPATHSLLDEY